MSLPKNAKNEVTSNKRPRKSDALPQYMEAVGKYPQLTKAEERRYAEDYIASKSPSASEEMVNLGKEAKTNLINSNLRLVVAIAKSYGLNEVSILDLVQEGNIALMKAIDGFDPDKGYRLSTYASPFIRRAIENAIREQGHAIHLPEGKAKTLGRIKRAKSVLNQMLGREPTSEEISSYLGSDVSTKKVEELLYLGQEAIPLEEETLDAGKDAPSSAPSLEELLIIMDETLDEREKRIILAVSGIGEGKRMTLSEVGQKEGISAERVRQIRERAYHKIRLRTTN